MTHSGRNFDFLSDPNYLALQKHYIEHPIALFTGAGVPCAKVSKYGLGVWSEFLKKILIECKGSDSPVIAEFDENLEQEWGDELSEMAEWVAKRCGSVAFKELVVKIVQGKDNFRLKRQLSGEFLSSAPTLRAVNAFCTKLVGVVKDTAKFTYRVSPNPRVRIVITSNYDPFLEAASSTMFIIPILKPVGAFGSDVGRLDQIPVFHIHGYVRVPEEVSERKKIPRNIKPFVDPVVTASDYKKAWREDDVYCPTMGLQIHILRHYATLFIGFSFRDRWINDLLKKLNMELEERRPDDRLYHYALMHRDEVESKGEDFFVELGVKPIRLDNFNEIKHLLGHLYQQALAQDYGEHGIILPVFEKRKKPFQTNEFEPLSIAQYWEDLYACSIRTVNREGLSKPTFFVSSAI